VAWCFNKHRIFCPFVFMHLHLFFLQSWVMFRINCATWANKYSAYS
jgi:hypothetical protein